MNKFSKLLVTAAILPGMVDAPIALANDLEDKNNTTTGKIKSSDAIQDSLKTLTLASTPVAESNVAVQDDDPVAAQPVKVYYATVEGLKLGTETIPGNVGDNYSTQLKAFDDYTFLGIVGQETGILDNNPRMVTYIYSNDKHSESSHQIGFYVDEYGNLLRDIVTGETTNGTLSVSPVNIDGYTLKETIGNTELVADPNNPRDEMVTFVYSKIPAAPVTVNYLNDRGDQIADPETLPAGNVGDAYQVPRKDIPNYTFKEVSNGSLNGTLTDQPQSVDLVYSLNEGLVLVSVAYIGNDTGNEIFESTTVILPTGEEVNESMLAVREIPGYTFEHTGGLPSDNIYPDDTKYAAIRHYYDKKTEPVPAEPVTVFYRDIDTNDQIKVHDELPGNVGDSIPTHPDIPGYTWTESYYSNNEAVFTDKPQTVTHYYSNNHEKAGTVTVIYVDNATNDEIEDRQYLENGNVGDSYDINFTDLIDYKDIPRYDGIGVFPDNPLWLFTKEDQTVTIRYQRIGYVTANYIDDQGNPMSGIPQQKQEGHVGTDYNTTAPDVPGYTLQVPDNYTGTFGYDDIVVNYVYTKNAQQSEKVTIEYVDQDMNPIATAPSVEQSGEIGTELTASPIIIDGYTFLEAKVDGITSSEANGNVSVTYDESEHKITFVYLADGYSSITVDYVDESGNKLLDSETSYDRIGEVVNVTAPRINNYQFKQTIIDGVEESISYVSVDVQYQDNPRHIQFVYGKTAGDVTINYVGDLGQEEYVWCMTRHLGGIVGETYETNPLDDDDEFMQSLGYVFYRTDLNGADGVFSDMPQEFTHYYKKKSAPVTIKYEDQFGNTIPDYEIPEVIDNKYVGDTFTKTHPIIDGYTFKEIKGDGAINQENGEVSFTFSESDQTATFVYEKDPVPAMPIEFVYLEIDESGNRNMMSKETISGKNVGDEITKSPRIFDGYTFKETTGNGVIGNDGQITLYFTEELQRVYFIYTKDQPTEVAPIKAADVTVKHVEKATGKELPGSYPLSGNVGDAIKSDPLEFDGYTFLETEWPTEATTDDGTPAFTANPQTVTHYYTKDPVKAADVTVDHVDEAGNKLAESEVKHGYIGDAYETQAKDIDGYTLKEVKGNAKGTHTDQPQKVTYVYSKNASDPIVPPVNSNDNQDDSTIVPPVNDDGGKTMVIEEAHSANTETNLTNPVQAESLPYAVQDGEHPELPETHADHKVALTVVGLLTALVIGMTSVIRPKKNQ